MKVRPAPLRFRASPFVNLGALAAALLAVSARGEETSKLDSREEAPSITPAPPATPDATQPAPTLTAEQRVFFRDLARLNSRQRSLASEASGRATGTATRDFAAWIIREHQTFAEELAALAKLRGDDTITRVEARPIKDRPAWANRDDVGYDEGYLRAVIEIGERISERLEAVSKSPVPSVAAFAQKQLPGLASRIKRAQDLQKDL